MRSADAQGHGGAACAAFIEAGCNALRESGCVPMWLQVNVRIEAAEVQWKRFVDRRLYKVFKSWIVNGTARHIWFMNKGQGCRWRFIDAAETLRQDVVSLFSSLEDEEVIAGWSFAPYDAELYQFGGVRGLELAHSFFTFDSFACLRYYAEGSERSLLPEEFSLILLDCLLRHVVEDEWELWDVWCKMAIAGRLPHGPCSGGPHFQQLAKAMREQLLPLMYDPDLLVLSGPEREIYDDFSACARALASKLRKEVEDGSLLWGVREILPFWIVFHWNRFGFSSERQCRLALAMTHVLNPRAYLEGA